MPPTRTPATTTLATDPTTTMCKWSTPLLCSSHTLTDLVWDTVKHLARIVSNLKLVVFPIPFRENPGKALRDWDLWALFFFIVF
ncbi:hypothetical protein Hanom_Chr01g00061851 [Helianthus anomalus]